MLGRLAADSVTSHPTAVITQWSSNGE